MSAVRFNTSPFFRTIFAALLTLALLASAVPLAVLSAAHSCSMPCCAGEGGGCATGACDAALFKPAKKSEEEKLCGAEESHTSHGAPEDSHAAPPIEASAKSDDCHSDPNETATREPRPASPEAETGTTSLVYARSLASPCPRDCCAATVSSTQSRRGREAALLSAPQGALPPGFVSLSLNSKNLPSFSAAFLKRLRARAPPPQLAFDSV